MKRILKFGIVGYRETRIKNSNILLESVQDGGLTVIGPLASGVVHEADDSIPPISDQFKEIRRHPRSKAQAQGSQEQRGTEDPRHVKQAALWLALLLGASGNVSSLWK